MEDILETLIIIPENSTRVKRQYQKPVLIRVKRYKPPMRGRRRLLWERGSGYGVVSESDTYGLEARF